jgi:predicted nucleic acid-binding Zn ribbon protein
MRCSVSNEPAETDDRGETHVVRTVNTTSAQKPTTGDNSVDSVDNYVTTGEDSPDAVPSEETVAAGPDLVRSALRAAREQAKSRQKQRTSAKAGGRRRRGWSGPRADDRDPQPFGRLAARLATDRGWSGRIAGGRVFGQWRSLVGDDVADHTKPVGLNEGELTVQADSTAWATQLRLLQRQILKRISDGVGRDVVCRIKVQGPAAPSWRYGPRHVPGRGPRDTYG